MSLGFGDKEAGMWFFVSLAFSVSVNWTIFGQIEAEIYNYEIMKYQYNWYTHTLSYILFQIKVI